VIVTGAKNSLDFVFSKTPLCEMQQKLLQAMFFKCYIGTIGLASLTKLYPNYNIPLLYCKFMMAVVSSRVFLDNGEIDFEH